MDLYRFDSSLHFYERTYLEVHILGLNHRICHLPPQVGAHPAAREASRARVDARRDGAHSLRHARHISSGSPQVETNIPKILPRE